MISIDYGSPKDIHSWMRLVRTVSSSFPGLETEEALSEHRQIVMDFMDRQEAICAKQDGEIVGVLLFSRENRARTLTPRMHNELIDHIEVRQAKKIDGIWEQHLVIHYNCVGALFIPDVFPLPAPQVSVNTRKGVVVNYAPGQLAV